MILHIIPASVFSNTYHGSYKDTFSRTEYLKEIDSDYRRILVNDDDPQPLLPLLRNSAAIRVLVEYTAFPRIVKSIKQNFPSVFVGVRLHNIEPCQHLDNNGWWPNRALPGSEWGPLWTAYGMGRLLRNDVICKRFADALYAISDWEMRVYWNWLPGRATVKWLPYYCPEHLIPPSIAPRDARRIIACLPTSMKNRKSWDLVVRFISFAEQMRGLVGDRFEFQITGNLMDWGLPKSAAVHYPGMVDNLSTFLQSVSAVAVLSDKGYGFKTTICDAVANGAVVFAHPRIASRCPVELKASVIAVDTERLNNKQDIAESLASPDTNQHVNAALRQRAVEELHRAYSSRNSSADS